MDDELAEDAASAKFKPVKWKKNALRHSFISYRVADTQNVAQVALEAGNSPAIIFAHYRELVRPAEAKLRALFERWVRRVSVEQLDSGCISISGAVESKAAAAALNPGSTAPPLITVTSAACRVREEASRMPVSVVNPRVVFMVPNLFYP